MALLHIEGFENASAIDGYLTRKHPNSGDAESWATGRFSGKSCGLLANDSVNLAIDDIQTLIVGFAYSNRDLEFERDIVRFVETATSQIKLRYGFCGTLQILRNVTLLAESDYHTITQGRWHYIELKVTIHNSAGAYEVRVDGDVILNATSVDTQATANDYVNQIVFIASANVEVYLDDIYVCDISGIYNKDFLGDVRVVTAKPDGDGVTTDFTINPDGGEDHYEDVDDGTTYDDDATYVESITSGHKDLFTYEDLSSIGDIFGVQVYSDVKESDGTDYALITVCRTNSSESDDAAQALTGAYLIYSRILDAEPLYAAPWTMTSFNAASFGIKVD